MPSADPANRTFAFTDGKDDREIKMASPASRRRELAANFEELLTHFGSALRRVANSYEADPALQEDLFQEICLAIWRALPTFRGEASTRTFVFRIAHNRGLCHGWREGRLPEVLEAPENVPDRDPSPESEIRRNDRIQRLMTAVHMLPLGLRQVITLRLEGLSHREIAEITGLTENNVMVRVSRARNKLKQLLPPKSENSDD